jgi:hypothetical protein
MKHLSFIIAGLLILLTAASCRKNHDSDPKPGVKEYTQLKPGNYWVYKTFNIGDTTVFSPPSTIDSIYVEKDTIIGAYTYHRVKTVTSASSFAETAYLRDSLDYLVDIKGRRSFSANDFTNEIFRFYYVAPGVAPNDSVGLYTRKMTDRDQAVVVPAGNFVTLTMRETIQFHPDNILNGQASRSRDTKYALGVGMVSEVVPYYFSVPGYTERRLIRYHVQ